MDYERTTKLLLSTFFFVEVSCDGIGAAYSNDVSNVFRRAATGQVEDRFIQALDQGAKSRCVSETLNHLVANVSSIEVREDEDVSRSRRCVLSGFQQHGVRCRRIRQRQNLWWSRKGKRLSG